MESLMGCVHRKWSRTKSRPPALMGPVRAACGEGAKGSGGVISSKGEEKGQKIINHFHFYL